MSTNRKQILKISSSGRIEGSASRALSRDLISALKDRYGDIDVVDRDLATGVPVVDEAWIEANFTTEASRTLQQRKTLAYSDTQVAELQNADVLVIGVSMYNFSITATLKAWIDMIARAHLTFRYTENGPQGLLSGKKAYLVVATGGVPVGSPMDFATPYLRHALAFVGITDVEIVAADRLNSGAEESLNKARAQIANLVHLTTEAA